jgi:hypothetical protein
VSAWRACPPKREKQQVSERVAGLPAEARKTASE